MALVQKIRTEGGKRERENEEKRKGKRRKNGDPDRFFFFISPCPCFFICAVVIFQINKENCIQT